MDSNRVITVATTLILGAIAAMIVLVLSTRVGGAVLPRVGELPAAAHAPAPELSAADVERIATAVARHTPAPVAAAPTSCCPERHQRDDQEDHWALDLDGFCADPAVSYDTYQEFCTPEARR